VEYNTHLFKQYISFKLHIQLLEIVIVQSIVKIEHVMYVEVFWLQSSVVSKWEFVKDNVEGEFLVWIHLPVIGLDV